MTEVSTGTENNAGNSFLSRARYPKGKRTLQAILDATYEVIISEGLTAASQEAIAKRAGVTQSAVRHYFPTKDELLTAFFSVGLERLQKQFAAKLEQTDADPRLLIMELADLQFARMAEVKDIYYYETSAYLSRNPQNDIRRAWYHTAHKTYEELIGKIHPEWNQERCTETAYQVFTLIFGSWITMGESLSFRQRETVEGLQQMLQRGIERLID